MRDIPDYYWKWTDYDTNTGERLVKSEVPTEILKKLVNDERCEFEISYRRTIINIDLDTGKIIPYDEAVKQYNKLEEEKIRKWKTAQQ